MPKAKWIELLSLCQLCAIYDLANKNDKQHFEMNFRLIFYASFYIDCYVNFFVVVVIAMPTLDFIYMCVYIYINLNNNWD